MSSNSSNSSNSSGEGGNTITPSPIQISPSKKWCFTFNNYTESDVSSIVPLFRDKCSMAIIGKEIGENGTPHLQGYVEFKTKLRPLSLGLPKSIHWEKSKGNRHENVEYCSKEGNVCCRIGLPEPVRIIKSLYPWQKRLVEAIAEVPDDRTIQWIWSTEGGVGKTCFQKYLVVKHDAIILGGKAGDVRNGVVEYMKGNNGRTPGLICINVPRSFDPNYVSYEAFENIKDMCFYSGKYEGGMVCGNPPHLLIFANFSPDFDKMSKDRWNVTCLD